MPEKISEPGPPKGFLLLLLRLPRWLYRWNLGFLLGDRFLLLKHTGRSSGRTYETVLEVVGHDRETDTYFVAVGFGRTSDWFLNLQKSPETEIRTGRRTLKVRAEQLSPEEGGDRILAYARNHPFAIRELTRFMGYRVDGTEQDYRALGGMLTMVALKPVPIESS